MRDQRWPRQSQALLGTINAAPEVMVEEVQRQLALIHGLAFIPDAQDAAYTDWGDEPFGRGWERLEHRGCQPPPLPR